MPSCTCKKRAKRISPMDLAERITIESASDTHNADGSITRTWSTAYTRWASVAPTGGAEPDQFRQIEGHATYRFDVRHDSTLAAELTASHRIVHDDGRIFDILRVQLFAGENRITITANDYGPVTVTDALAYDSADYDAILRNEIIEEQWSEAGVVKTRILPALIRISDFSPGITALDDICTINSRTYRIREMIRAERSDWYKLTLSEEHEQ